MLDFVHLFVYVSNQLEFFIFFLNLSAVSRTAWALFLSFLLSLNFLNWAKKSCKHWTGQCQIKFNTSVCLTPVRVDLRHFLVFCFRKILNASRKRKQNSMRIETSKVISIQTGRGIDNNQPRDVCVSHNEIFNILLYWFFSTPHYLLLIKSLAP